MRAECFLAILLLAQGCGGSSRSYTTDEPTGDDLAGDYELSTQTQPPLHGAPLRLTLYADGHFGAETVYWPPPSEVHESPWGIVGDGGTWQIAGFVPNRAEAITNWGVYLRRSDPEFYWRIGGTQALMITGYKGRYGLSYRSTNSYIWRKVK